MTREDAARRGEGRAVTLAEYATAVLYNGLGGYQAALAAAQRACQYDALGLFAWSLIELVEAAARSREPELAVDALERLSERTRLSGTDWAGGRGAVARPPQGLANIAVSIRGAVVEGKTASGKVLSDEEREAVCAVLTDAESDPALHGKLLRNLLAVVVATVGRAQADASRLAG